ncbi:MBL fold metallo-hydrolase [Ruminococcus gauvreauii]|uniref:MBL fold metallo-hydrolase n=1 Tax=Ruminococcus gauvreauii TaxID=438033 RepID=UPI003983EED8
MNKAVIQNLILGQVGTNCLLIKNSETGEMLIVDPADSAGTISQAVTKLNGNPAAVLLTHGHFDHILAVDDLRDLYEIPVYAYEKEQDVLEDSLLNLSAAWDHAFTTKADVYVKDNEKLTLAGFEITVFYTPGHTHGSCCYYLEEEKILVSGDTLFAGSVGRMDFPTSSAADMNASIKRLLKLPEDVEVWPGHEQSTTIGHEKRYNPFA